MVTLRFLCKTPFPCSSFLPSQAILSYPELKAASFIDPELICNNRENQSFFQNKPSAFIYGHRDDASDELLIGKKEMESECERNDVFMFSDEHLGEMSWLERGRDTIQVLCGCICQSFGDAPGRIKVFASGNFEISCGL